MEKDLANAAYSYHSVTLFFSFFLIALFNELLVSFSVMYKCPKANVMRANLILLFFSGRRAVICLERTLTEKF